ncbi:MAG: hypothetical protein CMM44_02930 [Rhodospirillaceae bacterium]|nr:hypothetical protein [Rhodospirillaceae bacterium]
MSKNQTAQTLVIERETRFGLWGVIIGFVGIFALSFILSPLAFILGLVGIFKGQIFTGLIAIIFSILGILTSVVIMGLIGLSTIALMP